MYMMEEFVTFFIPLYATKACGGSAAANKTKVESRVMMIRLLPPG